MVRCLALGEKILLSASGTQTEFTIEEIMGAGGSCIAYKVSYQEDGDISHKGILKEFFPAFLVSEGATMRSGTAVNVPQTLAGQFAAELENFKQTYRVINQYLSDNLSATNYHTVQMGFYVGNNTAYTLTSCDYGKSYDKLKDANLHSMFKLMYAVTKAVELYHNAGFLHLDIKPKNILVLDEVTDVVKLFDFDSLIPLQQFRDRTVQSIPSPGEYYVPELANCKVREIGIHTDVFEIGAMVFRRLFGRYPEQEDMRYDAVYPFEQSPLFVGVPPQAVFEIETLLRKTVQISQRSRYQTTAQLKEQLQKIIKLIGSDAPYLVDLPKWQPTKNFVGRSQAVRELDQRLQDDGYVFIKGIGGLGKSELVKYYVQKYASKYHTVQFCKFEDNLKSVVATLSIHGVDERKFKDFDELVRHKNKILHTCDQHTLIIVDNFNVTHDKFLRDFLPSNNNSFKVIFTTRCNLAADYYADKMMHLSKLSMDECKKLYCAHSGYDADASGVEEIIETVDYNTLVLVLLAQTMRKARKTPGEILSILEKTELDREQAMIFHEYDYSDEEIEEYNKINAHLNVIFDISSMSAVEKHLLKDMCLISQRGIGAEEFLSFCDTDAFSAEMISGLVDLGWLEFRNDLLVMHPIVSDLMFMNKDIAPDDSYYQLADNLESQCETDYSCHITILMDRVACALHLDRRYKNEDADRRVFMKFRLGDLYANIYRPKQAKAALHEAVELANDTGCTDGLANIYNCLGGVEKDFGTLSAAMEYFEKAIAEGKKLREEDREIVVDSMVGIASCLQDNGELTRAKASYEEALGWAKSNSLGFYVYVIARELASVCKELELSREEEKYTRMMQQYAQFAEETDDQPQQLQEMEALMEAGDYVAGFRKYEEILAEKREELGEDSPIYQHAAQDRWALYALSKDTEQAKRLVAQNLGFVEENFGADSMEMADRLVSVAKYFPRLQEIDYSIEAAKRAIEICHKLKQNRTKIALEAKLALANCYVMQGNPEQAKLAYADVDFSVFSGTEILSEIVTSVGMVLCELSEYEVVEKMCRELLQRGAVNTLSKAQTCIIYAICLEQKCIVDEAARLGEEAKLLLDQIADEQIRREWLVQYYRLAARLEYRRGNYQNAIEKVNESLAQFPEEESEAIARLALLSERGMYYTADNRISLAMEDYDRTEKIMVSLNMPPERFVLLYNNIAVTFNNLQNYEEAKKYLDKIVAIKPSVLEPSSYQDALICNNIGWNALIYEEDAKKAETILRKAAEVYRKNGATSARDYLTTLHNLSLSCEEQEKFDQCIKIYQTILDLYDEKRMDIHGQSRRTYATCYIRVLLAGKKRIKAISFAKKEDKRTVRQFGENSLQRIDFLVYAGLSFAYFADVFCMKLYSAADEAIKAGGHQNTVHYARLLNCIGVCYTDYYEDHDFALRLFNDAKALFDQLDETDDELYPAVLANIEYAKEKVFDKLIRSMAETLRNEGLDQE